MSFSADIGKWGTKTANTIQTVRKGVVVSLFKSVIMDTPVDTGRLRGNWQISIDNPANGILPTPDEGPNPADGPNGSAPLNTQAALDRILDVIPNTTGDNPIFLTNNLPYAHRVEFSGWSRKKAPAGMVRRNISRFNQIVKSVVNNFKK